MACWLTSKEYDRCLADLCVTDPRDDKRRIEDAKGGLLPAAYCWVLNHPDFRRWQDDAGCRLLWIKGDPGKGKTMLMCGIIDELEALPASNRLVYFFCQATDARLNNATNVLRSLIHMLVQQDSSLAKHIPNDWQNTGAKLFEGPNVWYTLSRIFDAILQDPGLQSVYFFIDALDECQHDLPKLLKLINQHSAAGRIKWILSSRNKIDVERDLRISESDTRLSLELKENAEQIGCAVDAYIKYRVAELAAHWHDLSLQKYAQQTLRTKAQSTFLWAALVVQELRKANSWNVKAILDEVPAGLNKLYDRMMQQIAQLERNDPKFCRQLLVTILTTYRPLSLAELGILSGLPANISRNSENLTKIAKLCGSFLTIRNNTVYFVHQSAKDYLLEKALSQLVFSDIAEIHHDIYLRSIEEMTSVLRRDIYDSRHPGTHVHEIVQPGPDPLHAIRYSCIYWVDHLKNANTKTDVQNGGKVQQFLEEKYLYWLEALALLEAISQGISSISKLLQLAKVRLSILIMNSYSDNNRMENKIHKSRIYLKMRCGLFARIKPE
jgi:hypothetical protein